MSDPTEVGPDEERELARPVRVLLVEDEDAFRTSLLRRLSLRGFEVAEVARGGEAVRALRQHRPDVVLLDLKLPDVPGEQVLRDVKRVAPEVQVVVLTGHGSIASASAAGRQDAFAYLEKPCETDRLVETLQAAARERRWALARRDMPPVEGRSLAARLWGVQGLRPAVLVVGLLLFSGLALAPVPAGLGALLSTPRAAAGGADRIGGYAGYRKMRVGETVAERHLADGGVKSPAGPGPGTAAARTGRSALVMVGTLCVAALFWATGALPGG